MAEISIGYGDGGDLVMYRIVHVPTYGFSLTGVLSSRCHFSLLFSYSPNPANRLIRNVPSPLLRRKELNRQGVFSWMEKKDRSDCGAPPGTGTLVCGVRMGASRFLLLKMKSISPFSGRSSLTWPHLPPRSLPAKSLREAGFQSEPARLCWLGFHSPFHGLNATSFCYS